MNKEALLVELKTAIKKEKETKFLKLPSSIDFSLQGNTLEIKINNGLTMNMQTNDSAFEGWAVCLKFNLPELIDDVKITWSTDCDNNGNLHYKRFLYRVWKFIKTFSWAKCDVYDFDNYSTKGWIINQPKKEASKTADKPEAKLERDYIEQHKGEYDCICNQLPVGLFNTKVGKENRETPGQNSQIDIWAIKEDTLSLFELKNETNKSIGIITELMFYVNVMKDLIDGSIKFYNENEDSAVHHVAAVRHFDKLYNAIVSKKIKHIKACFLTDKLHPLITKSVIDGISYSNITYSHKTIS